MRTRDNLILQCVVVAAFIALRFTSPGWLLIIGVFTGLILLAFVPIALAIWVYRCGQLDAATTAAFLGMAASLLVTGALVGDYADAPGTYIPLLMLSGVGEVGNDSDWLFASQIGSYCALAYLVLLGVTSWRVWQSRRVLRRQPPATLQPGATHTGW